MESQAGTLERIETEKGRKGSKSEKPEAAADVQKAPEGEVVTDAPKSKKNDESLTENVAKGALVDEASRARDGTDQIVPENPQTPATTQDASVNVDGRAVGAVKASDVEAQPQPAPNLRFEQLRVLTDRLFRNMQSFPLKTWTLFSQLRRKKLTVDQSRLVGEFFNLEDNGEWRIIGMRGTRNDIASIEYDVLRLSTRNIGINCTAFREAITVGNNDHVLKICNSDSSRTHCLFMTQYQVLKELARTYRNFRLRKHFPKVFGCGAFADLCYKEKLSSGEVIPKLLIYFPTPHPRPYFIQEKIEPTLEEVARMAHSGLLSVHFCREAIIGCIMALRLLHRIGYAHRCVAPYCFAIRKDIFSHHDRTAEQICLIDFTLCRKIKGSEVKPGRVMPFAGTYKYCSIAAHEHKEQLPSDDIMSCIYMLCEFLYGALPWKNERNPRRIKKQKKLLEADPTEVARKASRMTVDPSQLGEIFKLLNYINPYTDVFPYQKLYELLHSITEGELKAGAASNAPGVENATELATYAATDYETQSARV
uniref:Protein kinase domain-containing protein n=1 Tax=Ascaris lumbricoides TaxID=6252 RepID=A0A0M3IKC5_ASCLU